jgi:hypothetical protein
MAKKNWIDKACDLLVKAYKVKIDKEIDKIYKKNEEEKYCIITGNSGSKDIVKRKDLKKVLCICKGKLKIIETENNYYQKIKLYLLQCKKCKGTYSARTLTKSEVEKIKGKKE